MIAEGLVPQGRWGTAEDVGLAVSMLLKGSLPFSTGEVLNVDNYAVAPGAAREDMFVPLQEGEPYTVAGRENEVGHKSAGVPGALPVEASATTS